MPPSVSIGDLDATVHQVRWCAAFQTPTSCHGELEKYPVKNVEQVKFIMQHQVMNHDQSQTSKYH